MRALACAVACAPAILLPAPRAAAGDDPPGLAAALAVADAWFAAPVEEGRRAAEAKARALPPLEESDVTPLRLHVTEGWAAAGPRLDGTRGRLYRGKGGGTGEYRVRRGKKGGGLLLALSGAVDWAGDAGTADSLWGPEGTKAGFTVVSTQPLDGEASDWKREPEERCLLDLLDAALRTTDADRSRVVIAGYAMGTEGAWLLAGQHADRFAGVAALAGKITPHMKGGGSVGTGRRRDEYEGVRGGVLPNLVNLRTWFFHTEDDGTEPVHPDDIAGETLRLLGERIAGGYEHRYDRVTGRGHAPPKVGVGPGLEWLAERPRRAYPEEVVWETRSRLAERVGGAGVPGAARRRGGVVRGPPRPRGSPLRLGATPGSAADSPVTRADPPIVSPPARRHAAGAPPGVERPLRPSPQRARHGVPARTEVP